MNSVTFGKQLLGIDARLLCYILCRRSRTRAFQHWHRRIVNYRRLRGDYRVLSSERAFNLDLNLTCSLPLSWHKKRANSYSHR
jgi:hypothetical protein